jgi:hypothetical protein
MAYICGVIRKQGSRGELIPIRLIDDTKGYEKLADMEYRKKK